MLANKNFIYELNEIRVAIFESSLILPKAKHNALMTLFKFEHGFPYSTEEAEALEELLKFITWSVNEDDCEK